MRGRMSRGLSTGMLSLMVVACQEGQSRVPPASVRQPVNWIFAADLSASRNETQLREAQDFIAGILRTVKNGDRLTLMRVYEQGLADTSFFWTHDVLPAADPSHPKASDQIELEDAGRALQAELTVLFDPSIQGTLKATDIFATLYRTADLARSDLSHHPTLFLLSDMLQSTHDLNMERAVPDTGWVVQHAAERLLPDLSGVCIVAIGPDVSNDRGQRVLRFWRAYFHAAGADFRDSNYRNWASDASTLGCQ